MSGDTEWRWADPSGQQRLVRTDELLAALASGVIAPNTPVWRSGWKDWKPALEVPELTSSALASANGIVPNIPPPPLFMVAVQHDYEDKSVPQSRPAPTTEPPPPPAYVPAPMGGRSASRAAKSAVPQPAPSPTAPAVKLATLAQPPTMAGLGALPVTPPSPPVSAAPVPTPAADGNGLPSKKAQRPASRPDDTAWDVGKSDAHAPAAEVASGGGATMEHDDAPSPMGAEAKTVVDLTVLAPAHAPHVSQPTMHGIPALSQPSVLPHPPPLRPSSLPAAMGEGTAPPAPPSSSPPTASRPPPPLKKRSATLLLYGGAPQDKSGPESTNGEHSSINVPAPGAQAPKAVTQPPPWSEDWTHPEPTIPKPASPPMSSMRPKADSIEEITGAVLLSEIGAPSPLVPGQPAEELSASHIIPEDFPTVIDREAVTIAAKPTPLLPPPAKAHEADAPREDVPPVFPPDPPSTRIVHDLSAIWSHPKKRWMLAAAAAGAAVTVAGVIALVVHLVSGPPADAAGEAPSAAASAPSAVPSVAASSPPVEPAPTASSAPAIVEPATASANTSACDLAGTPHVIAPKAQIRIGVEAVASQNRLALGFVTGDKDGMAVALESGSLAAVATSKQHSRESIRRVTPLSGPGKALSAVADVEHKTDKIAGARSVTANGSFVLGSADGKLVWGTRSSDAPHPLWSLEGEGGVEAPRAVALEGGGYAIAFRQGAAVFLGALSADKAPSGDLVRVPGLGPQIGSPALGASGTNIVMAWADRASASVPWGVRLLEWKRGEAPGAAHSFAIPPGGLGEQAMSPGLAGLSGGRFLLAWTEGPVASHQVRAETLGPAGDPLGPPLTISAEGVNAGQGQVAVLPDGKGLVVYMASPSGSTAEVVATPVTCAPSPM